MQSGLPDFDAFLEFSDSLTSKKSLESLDDSLETAIQAIQSMLSAIFKIVVLGNDFNPAVDNLIKKTFYYGKHTKVE